MGDQQQRDDNRNQNPNSRKTFKKTNDKRMKPYQLRDKDLSDQESDSSLSPASPKKPRTEEEPTKRKGANRPSTPPLPDWSSFGLDPNLINTMAARSNSNFRQAISEEDFVNVTHRNQNITSASQPGTSSQIITQKSKVLPLNSTASVNASSSSSQIKTELKTLLEAYSLNQDELTPLISGYNDSEIRALILGIKFCYKYTMKSRDATHVSISNNLHLIQSQQSNIEQELKNLRANIGSPANILKSLEKKIEEGFQNLQKKTDRPVPPTINPPESNKSVASTSGISKVSIPSSTLVSRPPITLNSGSPSVEENALMLKKDKDSLIKRGLNHDLALKIHSILISRDPGAASYQTTIIERLKKNYDLTDLNNNQKFSVSIDKIFTKLNH